MAELRRALATSFKALDTRPHRVVTDKRPRTRELAVTYAPDVEAAVT